MMCCQSCGVEAPTRYVEFYQNIGAVVIRFSKSIKGNLCRNCISKHFWPLTLTTFFVGWLGIVSLIITPFILLNNIIRFLLTRSLEAPSSQALARAVVPELTDDVFTKMMPFKDELIQRLSNHEPMEKVADDLSVRAGVTTAQVALYFEALVIVARTKK